MKKHAFTLESQNTSILKDIKQKHPQQKFETTPGLQLVNSNVDHGKIIDQVQYIMIDWSEGYLWEAAWYLPTTLFQSRPEDMY